MRRLLLSAMLTLGPGCDSPPCPECPPAQTCPQTRTPVCPTANAPAVDAGDIKLTFAPAKSKRLERYRAQLSQNPMFEKIVAGINETIALPRDSAVLVTECGRIDAYYDPKAPGVVVCYELAEHFEKLFKGRANGDDRTGRVTGAVFFAFLHELGHMLVDQLELPITGKEEDAVDQLASVILIESGSGLGMALDGARAFFLNDSKGYSGSTFWSEHSFEKQRYYAILCMVYGGAPKQRDALTKGRGALPQERARVCPAEYARIKSSWQTLLAMHAAG